VHSYNQEHNGLSFSYNPTRVKHLLIAYPKTAPIIYLIRHGEKPPKNPDGSDADGLSAEGVERAQGLRQVFGADSPYDIKYIIAEHPKKGMYSSNSFLSYHFPPFPSPSNTKRNIN
jgi:hypothetical protein